MRIAFYTPLNTGSRDIESQALAFAEKHRIFLLTQSNHGPLHDRFRAHGFFTAAHVFSVRHMHLLWMVRWAALILFCWRHRIDIVYSHLEPANFVAVCAQFFVRARIVVCRHHMDYARLKGFDQRFSYRFVYRWARQVVVVSERTKQYMIAAEKIPEYKILPIPLSYDYRLFDKIDPRTVDAIAQRYPATLRLLTVCRLTEPKRPDVSVQLMRKLREEGWDAALIILGEGEERNALATQIAELGLDNCIFLPGHVGNVLDFMAASHFLIHPSISESSCISTKEAALAELPVIVCRGVGDFDDFFVHETNAFLVSPDGFVEESAHIIDQWFCQPQALTAIAKNLKELTLTQFNITHTADIYEQKLHHP